MTHSKRAGNQNTFQLSNDWSYTFLIRQSSIICSNVIVSFLRSGRNGLSRARIQFTGSSLGILSAYKRRQRAAVLVHDLSIISTLVGVFILRYDYFRLILLIRKFALYECLFVIFSVSILATNGWAITRTFRSRKLPRSNSTFTRR